MWASTAEDFIESWEAIRGVIPIPDKSRREIDGGAEVPDTRPRAWRGRVGKQTVLEFVVDCVDFENHMTVKRSYTGIGKPMAAKSFEQKQE